MEEDGARVNKLFEKAPLVGIQVQVSPGFCSHASLLCLL
jgi:hypothetical protein